MKLLGLAFAARPWVSALFVCWSIGYAFLTTESKLDLLTRELVAPRTPMSPEAEKKLLEDRPLPGETLAQKKGRLRVLHRQVQDLYLKEIILEEEVEHSK